MQMRNKKTFVLHVGRLYKQHRLNKTFFKVKNKSLKVLDLILKNYIESVRDLLKLCQV
jgi:hypothetical protein